MNKYIRYCFGLNPIKKTMLKSWVPLDVILLDTVLLRV